MPRVVYPQALEQKILALEAPGGPARSISLVVPTVAASAETLPIKVAALDEHGYASTVFDGCVDVAAPDGAPVARVTFRAGQPAVARVEDVPSPGPGFHRFRSELSGGTFHSNPVRVQPNPPERIYWGDPHVHTVLSRCHADNCRSVNFCYTAAQWLTCLDWVSGADHVSNDRCEFGKWREQSILSNLYDDPPRFATLPAYEASLAGGSGGDNNVYMTRWPDLFVDEYDGGNTKTLCEELADKLDPSEFFIAPHHTTRTGKHGEIPDAIYPGPDLMPVVEIHSKWGTSEYRGNPNPLVKVHDGPCYVQDLLARGLRLGFIGGTDTHATMPSGLGLETTTGHLHTYPGFTAACCPDLSRGTVFDAIRGRRCYAASLERVYLDATVAGLGQGEMAEGVDPQAARDICVAVAGKSDIDKVEIVRNGRVVHARPGDGWQMSVEWSDAESLAAAALESVHLGRFVYYYVRVTCTSGAQAWSSPVWLRP